MASVLAEHLGYLTLPGRNALYSQAISRIIKPGDVVVDLGCGVGVLGLLCLEAGAARVYGIDYSDAIELTRETVARAGLADRYHCLRSSTFHTELPEQADVVICDHVGYFGFDYGIIDMLADARKRLLKPGGKVMPGRLDLSIAGSASPRSRKVADGWIAPVVPSAYHWLREYGVNTKHRHDFAADDLCSDPAMLGSIALDADVADVLTFDCELTATRSGTFDGLACWFGCDLGGDVWMTNSPLAPDSIGRSQAFLPVREAFAVEPGDRIAVKMQIRHGDPLITWSIAPPGGKRQRLSTWNSRILQPADLAKETALSLTATGRANAAILALVDGARSLDQIEALALAIKPALFPSEQETVRFVRQVLGHHATC